MAGLIDIHVHYTGDATAAEQFVARWQAGGIEKAVVFAITANDGSHASLAQLSALAERFPDFVVPFGYLTLGHEDCLAQTREAISRGFKGLKLIFPAKPYDDDEYFPVYEAAEKAGMVCLFHTGVVAGTTYLRTHFGSTTKYDPQLDYQRRWRVSSNYMRPACLDRIARSFPEMTIIGAHIGASAWFEEATEVMRWNANVYFDLSIGQLHYDRKNVPEGQEARAIRPRLKELYDTGQLDLNKILFGTDGFIGRPDSSPKWALSTVQFELDAIGATEAEKQAVRRGTAASLLGL